MRIALSGWFWDRLETGSGQYVRRLAEALIAVDPAVELDIFIPSQEPEPAGNDTNPRLISRANPDSQLSKLLWEQVLMPRWARQAGADLLHVPYWAPPLRAALPVVVTVHDIIPLILPLYRGGWHVRAYTALVSAATPCAQIVLTDSEASRRDILDHLRVKPDRVHAIPLALGDAYATTPSDHDQHLRDMLGASSPYILYLGGFDARKQVSLVFNAFSTVCRACPDATLIVAGRLPTRDTAFTPDPRRLAREAKLDNDAVQFVGFVTEAQKLALYRGARAFVYPSSYEGFGYPPLEALACGTPVVASEISSLPEVVGDAGVLLPPGDVDGIAGALIQLLIDPSFHADLVRRAHKQIRRFSWQRTASETLNAYQEAMRHR